MSQNPPIRAWLESFHAGCVEHVQDWRDTEVPALRLQGRRKRRVFATLERAPRHAVAERYGYFVNEGGLLVFVLPRDATAEEAVYVAGDFNGWEQAVGDERWLMREGELNGKRLWLWSGASEGFWSEPMMRFKFVTGEHQWLTVPDNAPNSLADGSGNVNRVLDRGRSGRQVFRFTLDQALDLADIWQVAHADDDDAVPLEPGEFFFNLSTQLPLGAIVGSGETVFRLFAPRAGQVRLYLQRPDASEKRPQARLMVRREDEPHIWEARVSGTHHGWHYWYQIAGEASATRRFDPEFHVLDPYALAALGPRGPGIVLDSKRLGRADRGFQTPQWQDLVIAEAHVRDLAAHAPVDASDEERRGFTGLRKWVEGPDFYLDRLGVNCVELQPVQEADNPVPEDYHWGYMTANYFAPSSSYSLDPAMASGVDELRELVAAFHRRGIAVILDVVYNHVGEPPHLMFIDKLYYFESDREGGLANWSGCGNDLRASVALGRRLIIDSCVHLIERFGVDGFRFDLAELIGVEVLGEIEQALKRAKPDVILIAEPWSFRGHIAGALRDTGWASWNDGYRKFLPEYVRGGGSAETFAYFVKGSPWYWAKWPAQTVNYVESHDNRTWIDRITENEGFDGFNPTDNDRRRTRLMAAILFSSIGIPMISAGQDFLRSKHGVENTYQRGDLNALDYSRIHRFQSTHAYFAEWIAFRRSDAGHLLRLWSPPAEGYYQLFTIPDSPACALLYNADGSHGGDRLLLAVNPTAEEVALSLGAELSSLDGWRYLADGNRFYPDRGMSLPVEEEIRVPALGCHLWIRRA